MKQDSWRPTASIDEIKRRASVLSEIRIFFNQRGLIEVDTPLLCRDTVTDPFVAAIPVPNISACSSSPAGYLQTSPEYAMKRLLAAYGHELLGIYQLGKAFRDDPCSPRHNPEFTMLEWYRVGYSLSQLIQEVSELLHCVYQSQRRKVVITQLTYQEVFEARFQVNPHSVERQEILPLARNWLPHACSDLGKKELLDLMFSFGIEPELKQFPAVFITDYPECMSALARLKLQQDGVHTANRFELYLNGYEVANGYEELLDVKEHLTRFSADQIQRKSLGLPVPDIDRKFISAIKCGLPECSGVAMGVDRLLMALTGKSISGVTCFPYNSA